MSTRILIGDCRAQLRQLEADSVHACITSPPYFGLRAYGTNAQVWGGDPDHAHVFGEAIPGDPKGSSGTPTDKNGRGEAYARGGERGAYCTCGSWRGELGSEPTVEQFVANLVDVFREVRRVLHPSGVLLLNLGDSYAGSGKGPTGGTGINSKKTYWSTDTTNVSRQPRACDPGVKAKDLLEVPSDVVRALRADGWYLRSRIPWIKRAAMPESVNDRPTSAVEYVFLLSKGDRYYWDKEAVRKPHSLATIGTPQRKRMIAAGKFSTEDQFAGRATGKRGGVGERMLALDPNGRNFRNSDGHWLELDSTIAELEGMREYLGDLLSALRQQRAKPPGMILAEDGTPLVLDVRSGGFRGKHFATFPTHLVEPMIRAGSSDRGVCRDCRAPWVRILETTGGNSANESGMSAMHDQGIVSRTTANLYATRQRGTAQTIGWQPSCSCHGTWKRVKVEGSKPVEHELVYTPAIPLDDHPIVPATILDPFLGAGTTALVADRLQRDAVGCELNASYVELAAPRIVGEAPLFAQLTIGVD